MATIDLVEYEDDDGDFISVWMDEDEDAIIMQYNFLTITFTSDQFRGFVDALDDARNELEEVTE